MKTHSALVYCTNMYLLLNLVQTDPVWLCSTRILLDRPNESLNGPLYINQSVLLLIFCPDQNSEAPSTAC